MDTQFSTLPLAAAYLDTLEQLGFVTMTPIQARALPHLLEGKDVIGHAQTGTGKTAAFTLSLLTRLQGTGKKTKPQALVLCPTRELAAQVASEVRRLARHLSNTKVLTLCGGTAARRQVESLQFGVDVVVGTPGRVLDHLERESLDLSEVSTLVLDEADRMLDMGFYDDVEAIAEATAADRQTLLFSATLNAEVREIASEFQRDPIEISVVSENETPPIESTVYSIGALGREETLVRAMALHSPTSCVIFCNMRVTCDAVGELLSREGHAVMVLHGGMEQRERNDTLMLFEHQSVCVLVATDVAARGLDVDGIDVVVNYDLPKHADTFVHRVGRTARAGRDGRSVSLLDDSRSHHTKVLEDVLSEFEIVDGGTLPMKKSPPISPPMATVQINGGRKGKLRPGDIVGAFTNDFGLAKDDIGKITLLDYITFVAVKRERADAVVSGINHGRIKNKKFKARRM